MANVAELARFQRVERRNALKWEERPHATPAQAPPGAHEEADAGRPNRGASRICGLREKPGGFELAAEIEVVGATLPCLLFARGNSPGYCLSFFLPRIAKACFAILCSVAWTFNLVNSAYRRLFEAYRTGSRLPLRNCIFAQAQRRDGWAVRFPET